jgi:hypothetical protein
MIGRRVWADIFRFESYFDVAGIETSIPLKSNVDAKQLYTFQKPGSDDYPPHLNIIPKVDQVSTMKIFDFMQLLDTQYLVCRLGDCVRQDFDVF